MKKQFSFLILFVIIVLNGCKKSETPSPAPPGTTKGKTGPDTFYSIFTNQIPLHSDNDKPYELGMKFTSSVEGNVTSIRYYKMPGETGTHTGHLWNANGAELGKVEFTSEGNSGWQVATLNTPVGILPNTTYVVSVNSVTNYASMNGALDTVVTNGVLSTVTGDNGVFNAVPGSFPATSYQNSNYFRDIVFSPGPRAGDGIAPSIPAGLVASAVGPNSVHLSWNSSKDNVGVTGYRVYRLNAGYVDLLKPDTSIDIASLSSSLQYSFTVTALDLAGNESGQSSSVTITTTNGGDPITHGQQIDATNTGASGSLTVYNGNYTISQAGAIVQNLEIYGEVRVTAPNVTISNCKIHGIGDYYPLLAYDHATNLVISHCTIVGSAPVGSNGDIAGIALEADARITRCDIGGPWIGDGIRPAGNTVIEECYIHPLWNGRDAAGNSIDNTHNDGVQGEGSYGVQVIRCRIMTDSFSNAATGAGWNSAVFVDGLNGFNSSYWRIQDNYVAGGNYTIWVGPGTNNSITGNKVGRDFWSTGGMYGPTDLPVNPVNFTWSNNTWADTGQLLQP